MSRTISTFEVRLPLLESSVCANQASGRAVLRPRNKKSTTVLTHNPIEFKPTHEQFKHLLLEHSPKPYTLNSEQLGLSAW